MSIIHDFFNRFTSVVRNIVDFMLPIAESDAGKVISAMLPTALSIVENLGKGSLSSSDKRSAAVTALEGAAKTAGYAAAGSTLNLLVEMAVNKLNASK